MKNLPRVVGAVSKSVMRQSIEDVTARNILVFSLVLTSFATVFAIGVLYNSDRIALAERVWALASLRILGFTRAKVSTFLLDELAKPLAMVLGYLLASGIVQSIKNDAFDFAQDDFAGHL